MKQNNFGKWYRQRWVLILAVALAVIVLIGASIGVVVMLGQGDNPAADPQVNATTERNKDTDPIPGTSDSTKPSSESTEPSESEPDPTESSSVETRPNIVPPTVPPKKVIKFPYSIPGTGLVIQRVSNYSGVYLEDGSNVEMNDVAMMLIYNGGSQPVEYGSITLKYDDKTLNFVITALPAGGYMAVQETEYKGCAAGDLVECSSDIATMDFMPMSEDLVKVEDNGSNSLTITNLTQETIATIRIFYKYYLPEENAYVGGITYTARISNLAPGDSVVISPTHYVSDGSKVVMVRVYNGDV